MGQHVAEYQINYILIYLNIYKLKTIGHIHTHTYILTLLISLTIYLLLTYAPTDNIVVLEGHAMIHAKEVWGILRGLQTFTQMVYFNKEHGVGCSSF